MITISSISNQAYYASKFMKTQESYSAKPSSGIFTENSSSLAKIQKSPVFSQKYEKNMAQVNNGVSILNLADTATTDVQSNLQKLRDVAVRSLNKSLTDQARTALNEEATKLKLEINKITDNTAFNGVKILAKNDVLPIQYGGSNAHYSPIRTINLKAQLNNKGLESIRMDDQNSSQKALKSIDDMISITAKTQSNFKAQNSKIISSAYNLRNQKLSFEGLQNALIKPEDAIALTKQTSTDFREQQLKAFQAQANISAPQTFEYLSQNTSPFFGKYIN